MTLVEKMAKAMYESHEFVRPWEHPDAQRIHGKYLRNSAIAALKAMKNPPPSIKVRGAKALFNNQDLAHDAWDQMIDQAIKEGE